jgi:hypothetical protein
VILFLLASVSLLAFGDANAAAAADLSDRIAITQVIGPPDVKVIHAAGQREENLHRGDNLFVGDEVRVAPKQLVHLTSHDDAEYKLAPGSSFKIESRKPDKQTLSFWTFQILEGAMFGSVIHQGDKDGYRLKVKTPTAALGVRGTRFLVLVEKDKKLSSTDVLEGKVWWGTDLAFPAGSYREISAHHHGEVGADGRVSLSDSKGEEAKLLRDYGFVLGEEGKATQHGSAQECATRGLGWRSGDGSNGGECFKEELEKEE